MSKSRKIHVLKYIFYILFLIHGIKKIHTKTTNSKTIFKLAKHYHDQKEQINILIK